MGEGLRRAANAARATRGLAPRKVHLRSNQGDWATCGVGAPSQTVWVAAAAEIDFDEVPVCGNCLRIHRAIERDRAAQQMARESLLRD